MVWLCYHLELSEVLWNMVFSKALGFSGAFGSIAVFLIFAAWAGTFLSSSPTVIWRSWVEGRGLLITRSQWTWPIPPSPFLKQIWSRVPLHFFCYHFSLCRVHCLIHIIILRILHGWRVRIIFVLELWRITNERESVANEWVCDRLQLKRIKIVQALLFTHGRSHDYRNATVLVGRK